MSILHYGSIGMGGVTTRTAGLFDVIMRNKCFNCSLSSTLSSSSSSSSSSSCTNYSRLFWSPCNLCLLMPYHKWMIVRTCFTVRNINSFPKLKDKRLLMCNERTWPPITSVGWTIKQSWPMLPIDLRSYPIISPNWNTL